MYSTLESESSETRAGMLDGELGWDVESEVFAAGTVVSVVGAFASAVFACRLLQVANRVLDGS